MTIHELLEYGPIVAHDEELDLLVTVNGAYFNLWVPHIDGYMNTEAFAIDGRVKRDNERSNGLYGLQIVDVMDAGTTLLEEILAGDEEE